MNRYGIGFRALEPRLSSRFEPRVVLEGRLIEKA
jgi:hypothetical protein